MARTLDPRSLRHRRRLRRPVGCGRRRGARRPGGADREGQDGRRMPQHRLRAVEGAARRRRRAPRRSAPRSRSASSRSAASVEFCQVQRSRAGGDRGDRAERFEGAFHRPRRSGDRGRSRASRMRRPSWSANSIRDRGAALRDRDRFAAGGAADPGPRQDAVSSPTRRCSNRASGRSI